MVVGLDIAAGIAGLITLADVVIDRTWRTIRACKNAGKDSQELLREVQSLHGVLSGLQKLAGQVTKPSLSTHVPAVEIYGCQQMLTKLRDKLLKADPNEDGLQTHRKWLRTLKWPITSDETRSILVEIERFKSTFDLTVSMDVLETVFASTAEQSKIARGVDDVRKALEDITQIQITAEKTKVLDFFGTSDAAVAHGKNTQLRQEGTGLWLTKGLELQNWLVDRNSKLWMFGLPGAGKTVLTAAAIEETLLHVTAEHGLAYYYCDYTSPKSLNLQNMVACLCGQLARQNEECFDMLSNVYQPEPDQPPRASLPPLKDLTHLLLSLTTHFDSVSILVDGIDECDDRPAVAMALSDLASKSSQIRMLISSRDDQAIRPHLQYFDLFSIAAKNEDLKLYVSAEITQRTEKGTLKIKSTALKDEILDKLVNGADGMFRWVACQMDHLSRLRTDAARRKALLELPPDLATTYDRILERVNVEGDETAMIVQKVLCWLFGSFQLSSDELCEAVAVEGASFDHDAKPDVETILLCCGSLVRSGMQSNLELAHFTVKEYLQSDRIQQKADLQRYYCNEDISNAFKAKTCLEYICLPHSNETMLADQSSEILFLSWAPFYEHAARCWYDYYASVRHAHDTLEELICKLFTSPGLFETWRRINTYLGFIEGDQTWISDEDEVDIVKNVFSTISPLHYAAILRLHRLIDSLIKKGHDANEWSMLGPPIFCAFLLEFPERSFGLKMHDEARLYRQTGQEMLEQTICSLSASGADLNCCVRLPYLTFDCPSESDEHCTPLCKSLSTGCTQKLLEVGASLTDHTLESILQNCQTGKRPAEDLSALIVSKSVDNVNQKLFLQVKSQLMPESAERWVQTTTSLESLPDPGEAKSFMDWACLNDVPEAIQWVLENSSITVDEQILDGSKATALHIAAGKLSLRAVNFLLARGADPNVVDRKGQTPLHDILDHSDLDQSKMMPIVNALFDHGAKIIQDFEDNTCLQYWDDQDHPQCLLRLILERGATGKEQDFDGRNLLHRFALFNMIDGIRTLQDCLPAQRFLELAQVGDSYERFPIHLAALYGCKEAFEVLKMLDYTTSVGVMETADGRSLLHHAVHGAITTGFPLSPALDMTGIACPQAADGCSPMHECIKAISGIQIREDDDSSISGASPPSSDTDNPLSDKLVYRGDGRSIDVERSDVLANFRMAAQILFERSPDVSLHGSKLGTPLHSLCDVITKHDCDEIIDGCSLCTLYMVCLEILYSYFPDISEKNEKGLSVLEILLERIHQSTILSLGIQERISFISETAFLKLLSRSPAPDIAGLSCGGHSALSVAACLGNTEILGQLLKLGAPVDCAEKLGGKVSTPLQLMCEHGCSAHHVKIALESSQESRDQLLGLHSPWSLLHLATSYFGGRSCPAVFQVLVDAGIPIDATGGPQKKTPLTIAIEAGSLDDVNALIECGADPSRRVAHTSGRYLFSDACYAGHVQIAKRLKAAGATWLPGKIHASEKKLRRPLFGNKSRLAGPLQLASFKSRREMVKQILQWKEEGCEGMECSEGPSALFWASWSGHTGIVAMLIENGFDLDAVDPVDGYTALHAAASKGKIPVVEALLEAGCNASILDNLHRSAQMHAFENGHSLLAQLLERHSEEKTRGLNNVRPSGTAPYTDALPSVTRQPFSSDYLLASIKKGDLKTVRRLNSLGEDMSRTFSCGFCTPLLLSMHKKKYDITTFLLDQGVPVEGVMCGDHGWKGDNVYHLASISHQYFGVLERLLGWHPVPSQLRVELSTMLCLCAAYDNVPALQKLISTAQAMEPEALEYLNRLPPAFNFEKAYIESGTPLHFAMDHSCEEPAKILLNAGVHVDKPDLRMNTPLHVAATKGGFELACLLLDRGANVNSVDDLGRSPLHLAAEQGHQAIVDELLYRGADPQARDVAGQTALTLAAAAENSNVIYSILGASEFQEPEARSDLLHMLRSRQPAVVTWALNANCTLGASDYLWPWWHGEAPVLRKLIKRFDDTQLLRSLLFVDTTSDHHGPRGPLHDALTKGVVDITIAILDAGAFINFESGPSGTPLMHACRAGRLESVRVLVRMGALISYSTGTEIVSALQEANHFPEIIRWILVDRFIEQRKIDAFTPEFAIHTPFHYSAGTTRSYAPATRAREVPWDTKRFIARGEIDDLLQQRVLETRIGPFAAREDGYTEHLERQTALR